MSGQWQCNDGNPEEYQWMLYTDISVKDPSLLLVCKPNFQPVLLYMHRTRKLL